MTAIFPSAEWIKDLEQKLNSDERYNQIASKWEGDFYFQIEAEGNLKSEMIFYIDLWHGKCRRTEVVKDSGDHRPAFVLKANYGNFVKVLKGELDPMQAMLTRKLDVKGNIAYIMRNVPTVLDFVRCAREVTSETV